MSKLVWTTSMDAKFLQAMFREQDKVQDKGNRLDGTLTSQAYTNMVEELSKIFEKDIKKDHLKNRLKTLKEHFSQFYDVFRGVSLSGFSWDPTTKLLGAEDEVWEELVKNKPEAAKWKIKQIIHYNEMLELFAKDRATGLGAQTAKERRKRLEKNNLTAQTIEEIDELLETNDVTLESFTCNDDTNVASKQVKLPSTSKSKKRKVEEDDPLLSIIKEAFNNVASAIDRGTKVLESSHTRVYLEDEIYKELEVMGMEPDELANAYLFLVEPPEKTRALFGCPLAMRRTILGKMMGARE